MFKKLLLVLVILVGGVLALATRQPDSFSVERSTTIKAAPDKIFALVQDFHEWAKWSPWEKLDPEMKRTHSGAASGKGAIYAWEGNSDVGEGQMEIVEVTAPSRVGIKLDFVEPFEARSQVEFTFVPAGDSTAVKWSMAGENNFLSKIMCVFMSMDKMVGKDYETGLANLKSVAEK